MSSLLEGAKRLVSRGSELGDRIEGLERASGAARGRLDDRVVDEAEAAAQRVATRLGLAADHTVVALAGATGSGKSSTFNALAGVELSSVGVRRPTTSWATACVWGQEGADELLEYLGIAPRHQVMRDSLLDLGKEDSALQGVVLLDLPDHDSTEVSHHLEVDRLIELADLMVWVLDPQKYADAAVHDRYLAPLSSHKDVMLVVLNHIDEVPVDRRESMMADVRRLVDADGLDRRTGAGGERHDGRGHRRAPRRDRAAGQGQEGHPLAPGCRRTQRGRPARSRPAARAPTPSCRRSGSPLSTTRSPRRPAYRRSWKPWSPRPGCAPTGPPVGRSPRGCRGCAPIRSSASTSTSARTASSTPVGVAPPCPPRRRCSEPAVDSEVRAVADDVSAPLTRPWAESVRRASVSRLPDLNDRLDSALGATELNADRIPVWAGFVRVLQWLLLLAALGGAVWLGVLATDRYLGVSEPSTPDVAGFPVPTVLLLGGVVLGIVLSLLCRLLVSATARSRARSADRRLRSAIAEVADELVVAPVRAELTAYDEVRDGLARALS